MLKPTSKIHKLNPDQIRAKLPSFAQWIEHGLQQPLENVLNYDVHLNYIGFIRSHPAESWEYPTNKNPTATVTVNFANREPAVKEIKLVKNEEGAYVWDQEVWEV